MKRKYKALLIILCVLTVATGGIFFYIKSPDMRPLGSYFTWMPSWDDFKEKVPFLHPAYVTPPTISPQVAQQFTQDRAKYQAIIQQNDKREEQIVSQLKSAGIPVGGAYIVDSEQGEPMLALNLTLAGSVVSGDFVRAVADSMIRFSDLKTLDLTGLAYVNMFLTDKEDRIIFGVTAKTSDIQNYRTGKISLEQFFSKTAAKVESRSGAFDAIAGGLRK